MALLIFAWPVIINHSGILSRNTFPDFCSFLIFFSICWHDCFFRCERSDWISLHVWLRSSHSRRLSENLWACASCCNCGTQSRYIISLRLWNSCFIILNILYLCPEFPSFLLLVHIWMWRKHLKMTGVWSLVKVSVISCVVQFGLLLERLYNFSSLIPVSNKNWCKLITLFIH